MSPARSAAATWSRISDNNGDTTRVARRPAAPDGRGGRVDARLAHPVACTTRTRAVGSHKAATAVSWSSRSDACPRDRSDDARGDRGAVLSKKVGMPATVDGHPTPRPASTREPPKVTCLALPRPRAAELNRGTIPDTVEQSTRQRNGDEPCSPSPRTPRTIVKTITDQTDRLRGRRPALQPGGRDATALAIATVDAPQPATRWSRTAEPRLPRAQCRRGPGRQGARCPGRRVRLGAVQRCPAGLTTATLTRATL